MSQGQKKMTFDEAYWQLQRMIEQDDQIKEQYEEFINLCGGREEAKEILKNNYNTTLLKNYRSIKYAPASFLLEVVLTFVALKEEIEENKVERGKIEKLNPTIPRRTPLSTANQFNKISNGINNRYENYRHIRSYNGKYINMYDDNKNYLNPLYKAKNVLDEYQKAEGRLDKGNEKIYGEDEIKRIPIGGLDCECNYGLRSRSEFIKIGTYQQNLYKIMERLNKIQDKLYDVAYQYDIPLSDQNYYARCNYLNNRINNRKRYFQNYSSYNPYNGNSAFNGCSFNGYYNNKFY